jgi:hypothetical protein
VSEERDPRLGASGVFKAIVDSVGRVKRALSESEDTIPPAVNEVGEEIGRLFIANRFEDLHAMSAPVAQAAHGVERFVSSWRDAVEGLGPFTSFEVANAGAIDLAFVPSLEEIPQEQFAAFLEISFSNPTQEDAFTIGAVLLDDGGQVRIGALHAR